jgi:hypothetical protein
VLLPQAGREKVDLKGGMGVDALQHIDEVNIRIDSLEAARREDALHNPNVARSHLRPVEEPIAALGV